jgi:CRISPR-associated protein Cas2
MLVMILEKTPASLRGFLSRWMIEPRTGVFLGNPNSRIRDKLWEHCTLKAKEGAVLQLWNDSRMPQGYRYRSHGETERKMTDVDGLALVLRPERVSKTKRNKKSKAAGAEQD